MRRLLVGVLSLLLMSPAVPALAQGAAPAASSSHPLDFETFRTKVQPILLASREGLVRCITCHGGKVGTRLRLEPLSDGAAAWTEEQSRKNFASVSSLVVPGSPMTSRLLLHPLDRQAGGDAFHGGGKHWRSQLDPEWQTLAAWVRGPEAATAAAPAGG